MSLLHGMFHPEAWKDRRAYSRTLPILAMDLACLLEITDFLSLGCDILASSKFLDAHLASSGQKTEIEEVWLVKALRILNAARPSNEMLSACTKTACYAGCVWTCCRLRHC